MKKTMDFERWTPNIRVAVWERGNAEIVKAADCPLESPPDAKKRGDCGNCKRFMGVRIPDGKPVYLGDVFPGSCWEKIVLADKEAKKAVA